MFRFVISLILSALILSVICEDPMELGVKLAAECKKNVTSNVKLPTLEEMIEPEWETTDPVVKCYVHCIALGFGEITPEGVLVLDELKKDKWADDDKTTKAFNKCKDVGKDLKDKCERSYQQYDCFFNEVGED